MKFVRDAPRVLIASVVVVVSSMAVASNLLFGGMTSTVENEQLAMMKSIIDFNLDGAATNALARAEILASTQCIRDALTARDRPRLLAETQAMFAEQREKYAVDQVQFHVPPATSFLRLQAPQTFGDDLTRFRPIVVAVNREHVAKKGIAIARTGPGIFGVAPIRGASGEHIGSVEFGIDFGSVLDRLKAAYGLDLTLFMEEAPLREFAPGIRPGILTEANRVGHMVKFHSTNWSLMQRLVGAPELRVVEDTSQYTREALGVTYGVLIVPIRNGSGQVIGTIVAAKSFASTRAASGRSRVTQGLLALFAIVLLAGVILIVLRGFLLRPLQAITARFAAMNSGADIEAEPDDVHFCDEITALAREQARLAERTREVTTPTDEGGAS